MVGVEAGVDRRQERRVAVHVRTRRQLDLEAVAQRRGPADRAGQLHPFEQAPAFARFGQEVEVDPGGGGRG